MILRPTIFEQWTNVLAGMSTRISTHHVQSEGYLCCAVNQDGQALEKEREMFFRQFSIQQSSLAIPQQRHTDTVLTIHKPGVYPNCDGLITSVPQVYLTVVVADCVPVLVYDSQKKVVSSIHAGWRGVSCGIVRKAIGIMRNEFQSTPESLWCFLGPCAGVCCYEVGIDVASHFKENVLSTRNRKLYLNLKEAVRQQLLSEGVIGENIEIHPDCTICKPEVYYSYRREKEKAGRMIAFIGMKE